jgi:hypothetical protein
MDTSDLIEELHQIDDIIHQEADRLSELQQPRPAHSVHKTNTIYNLPTSMSGLGLPSYVVTRPAARAAALEVGRLQLRDMGIPDPTNEAPAQDIIAAPRSQRERMQAIHRATVENLLQRDDILYDSRSVFIDNASKWGSAWLSAIPKGNHRRLTNAQVTAALRMRTQQISFTGDPLCRLCLAPQSILHAERCRLGPQVENERHNYLRDHFVAAVKAANNNRTIISEPPVNNNPDPQRADIFIGTAAGGPQPDGTYGFIDFKVKSILATDTVAPRNRARAAYQAAQFEQQYENFGGPAALQVEDTARSEAYRDISTALEVAHAACIRSYENVPLPQRIFPFVVSSGGTLHRDAQKCIKELIPDKKARRQLAIDASLTLLKARAAAYQVS